MFLGGTGPPTCTTELGTPQQRFWGRGSCYPGDLGVQGLILVPPAFGTHFGAFPLFLFFYPPFFYPPPWAPGYGPPTSP